MADISTWKNLLPEARGQWLILNLTPSEGRALLTNSASCQTLWLDRRGTEDYAGQNSVTPGNERLPFADQMFDGVIARLKRPHAIQLISEISRVLQPLGTVWCLLENISIKEPMVRRRMEALHFEFRSFIAMPAVEHPWYILPADDIAVSRYFFLNILSSRHRTRRLAIALVRLMARAGGQRLLLGSISHRVIIGRKAPAA